MGELPGPPEALTAFQRDPVGMTLAPESIIPPAFLEEARRRVIASRPSHLPQEFQPTNQLIPDDFVGFGDFLRRQPLFQQQEVIGIMRLKFEGDSVVQCNITSQFSCFVTSQFS